MSSSRQSAVRRPDGRFQLHPSHPNLHKWAESDAQFVRSLSAGVVSAADSKNTKRLGTSPAVVDSYSCRQKFLRSYTFSKKETVPEKTAKCLGNVRKRVSDLPCVRHPMIDGRDIFGRFTLLKPGESCKAKSRKKGRRSVIWCIFRRLLSCVSSFDVADGNSVVHAL